MRSKTEQFIMKAQQVHGDFYKYHTTVYIRSKDPVEIVCPEHGAFYQTPNSHLNGKGCKECSKKKTKPKLDNFTLLREFKQVHSDKYDYGLMERYERIITIVCPIHGEFTQDRYNHLRGNGCIKCRDESFKLKYEDTIESFSRKANEVHLGKYLYDKVSYAGAHTPVTITCKEHGTFLQRPYCHIGGQGCPSCATSCSGMEQEVIDFISSLRIDVVKNDRSIISPYELDIVLPEHKLAIEFNGLRWHSEQFQAENNYHLNKTRLCEEQGYQLIHIFEDEWLTKQNIVKTKLISILNKSSKGLYARQTKVEEVSVDDYTEFMQENHIQGAINASVRLGLYHNNELVACVGFKKMKEDGHWDLVRYATNQTVVGGFSKLLSYFKRNYDWHKIITFADKRYSVGNLYLKNGFDHLYDTTPNYFYTKNRKRYSRQQFQKHKLKGKLDDYDPNLSEHQNMLNNGYYRIYDCGHMKFEMKRED